jgi:hypothetical protein
VLEIPRKEFSNRKREDVEVDVWRPLSTAQEYEDEEQEEHRGGKRVLAAVPVFERQDGLVCVREAEQVDDLRRKERRPEEVDNQSAQEQ